MNWTQTDSPGNAKQTKKSERLRLSRRVASATWRKTAIAAFVLLFAAVTGVAQRRTAFMPSEHGFRFENEFTYQLKVNGISFGGDFYLCGGITRAALDRFYDGRTVETDTITPQYGHPLFMELLGRQRSTLSASRIRRMYDWQSAPDKDHWYRKKCIGRRTAREWPQLKALLDAGKPTSLWLIRNEGYLKDISNNHQVLAYGYDYNKSTKDVTILIYDCNYLDDTTGEPQDDITVQFNLRDPGNGIKCAQYNTKGKIDDLRCRGFFVMDYDKTAKPPNDGNIIHEPFSYIANGKARVIYLGADKNLYHVAREENAGLQNNAGWFRTNLNAETGMLTNGTRARIRAFADVDTGVEYVYCVDLLRHLQELSFDGRVWRRRNLSTEIANLSAQIEFSTVDRMLAPFYEPSTRSRHIVFIAYDEIDRYRLRLWDLQITSSGIHVLHDITKDTGVRCQLGGYGLGNGYTCGGEGYVALINENNDLYELHFANGRWQAQNLAPIVGMHTYKPPSAYGLATSRHIIFDRNGGNHELRNNGVGWQLTDINAVAGEPGYHTMSTVHPTSSGHPRILCQYANSIRELEYNGTWSGANRSQLANALVPRLGPPPVGVELANGKQYVFYRGADDHLHALVDRHKHVDVSKAAELWPEGTLMDHGANVVTDGKIWGLDFDGDGKQDQVVYRWADHSLHFGRSRGATLQFTQSLQAFLDPDNALDRAISWTGQFDGQPGEDILIYHAKTKDWDLLYHANGQICQVRVANTSLLGDLLEGQKMWIGRFEADSRDDLLLYDPSNKSWRLMSFFGRIFTSKVIDYTPGFGDLMNGPIFWAGDFDGDGIDDILFHNPPDRNWILGRYVNGLRSWVLVDTTIGFGDMRDAHIWAGDFDGDGNDDILFHYAPDGNWFLGRLTTGDRLAWTYIDNTVGFGNLCDGVMFFPGDYDGDGVRDILFHYPGDGNWILGRYVNGQRTWSLVANTKSFGDVTKWTWSTGDINGDGIDDLQYLDESLEKWGVASLVPIGSMLVPIGSFGWTTTAQTPGLLVR